MNYETTYFELVLANHVVDRLNGEPPEYALGIVDVVDGTEFGFYADCGIVTEGGELETRAL